MGNANFIELETCIDESLQFCEKNPDLEFVQVHHPRLEVAKRKFYDGLESSDAKFIEWQKAGIEEKLRWKKLGKKLAEIQRDLARVNAQDAPSKTVRHWDIEILEAHIHQMTEYLESKADVIEGATGWKDDLGRALGNAKNQTEQRTHAFGAYGRYARMRAEGLGTLNSVLGDFRQSMRRHLGKSSDLYLSIRWPMSLEPDTPVL